MILLNSSITGYFFIAKFKVIALFANVPSEELRRTTTSAVYKLKIITAVASQRTVFEALKEENTPHEHCSRVAMVNELQTMHLLLSTSSKYQIICFYCNQSI